jgi:hypothetical protein
MSKAISTMERYLSRGDYEVVDVGTSERGTWAKLHHQGEGELLDNHLVVFVSLDDDEDRRYAEARLRPDLD